MVRREDRRAPLCCVWLPRRTAILNLVADATHNFTDGLASVLLKYAQLLLQLVLIVLVVLDTARMYVPALGVCRIGVAFGRREHEIATTLGKGDRRHSF